MDSLPRQKIQFWNFTETWQICVNSYKKHTYLATEVIQVKNDHSPEIMKEIFVFQENETYNLSSGNHLARRNIWTTQYGIESVSNLGASIRDLLSGQIKNSSYVSVFKHKIRKWNSQKRSGKVCQIRIKKSVISDFSESITSLARAVSRTNYFQKTGGRPKCEAFKKGHPKIL